MKQIGTTADEEVWGVTADAAGNAYVAGYTGGDFDGTPRATRTSSSRGSTRPER